jgi:capsular exopolysaccharide synthesis family protein
MTVMEALEKAKRLREEREGAGVDTRVARNSAAEARRIAPDTGAPPPPVELPVLKCDRAAHEIYRVMLMSDRDQHPVAQDAYRILRTRLGQRISHEGWNRLGVTSAGPGEGKSVTAINLALSMAREGKRNIVLIDLDLRSPSVSRYLGIEPPKGIGDYLAGQATIDEVMFSIGINNFAVIGGRKSYEHSAELLGGDALRELFANIHRRDPGALVVVDLPPLLSVADTLVVAPRLSAVLLVVAEGKTRRDGMARALELLGATNLAGIVLNHSLEVVNRYYG